MMLQIYCALAVLLFADGSDKPVDPTLTSLLAAHNRKHQAKSFEPLKLSDKLYPEAAAVHARDMAGSPDSRT